MTDTDRQTDRHRPRLHIASRGNDAKQVMPGKSKLAPRYTAGCCHLANLIAGTLPVYSESFKTIHLLLFLAVISQPSVYIDGWLYAMRMTSVVWNVPVLSQNDSTYHHSVFTAWKWHPFATWTPSFIILVRKLKKNPKNTHGRLAIPALAGLLVFTTLRTAVVIAVPSVVCNVGAPCSQR